MVQQITQGIKISVVTGFEGTFYREGQLLYAFKYTITIENQSKDVVQLASRYWKIYDSLNHKEIVTGAGIVGKKPILKPGEKHVYTSGCLLLSTFGAMKGYYTMVNLATTRKFRVKIPAFKLYVPFAVN